VDESRGLDEGSVGDDFLHLESQKWDRGVE